MATYFTESQTRVLKSAWICLIPLVIQTLIGRYAGITNVLVYNGIYTLTLLFLLSWEFLYARDWKKAGILAGTSAGIFLLTLGAYYLFDIPATGEYRPYIHIHMFSLINMLATLFVRCYLAGNTRFIITGTIVTLVTYYGFSGGLFGLYGGISNLGVISYSPHGYTILSILYNVIYVFAYFIALYLSENYFNRDHFKAIFHSKVQLLGAKEYFLLYVITGILILNASTSAPQHLGIALSYFWHMPEYSYYPRLTAAALFPHLMEWIVQTLLVLLCGYFMRNVIVARMMTTGSRNGLLYFLHFIPLLNIIPLTAYTSRQNEHKSPVDNAMFYIQREPSQLRSWIVVLGILTALYFSFMTYRQFSYYKGTGSNTEEMIMALIVLLGVGRLLAFLLMFNYRKAIFAILCINIFLLFCSVGSDGGFELLGLRLALTYMSMFFLLEIFHPTLFDADAVALEESLGNNSESL
ncbi:hypothetical protein [Chitinophaga barathri]|uniref:Uncharacterized protein n=1 Tax=Chitinophaga barathri TaxID=1647451 RepID=A0A3N4MSG6_9BACT|nr:hypothetical protein [Chitinophaga barathri]RPD42479.1 hypothetical protein EG028_04705 [Chitinophaga barathri]